MNLNKKVTQEQMKGYKSVLTKEQGEAQLREDARTSFVKTMLEGQAKRERARTKRILVEILEWSIAISYVLFAFNYITK